MSLTYEECDDPIARIVSKGSDDSEFIYLDKNTKCEPEDPYRDMYREPEPEPEGMIITPEMQQLMREGVEAGLSEEELITTLLPYLPKDTLPEPEEKSEYIGRELELEGDDVMSVMPSPLSERVYMAGRSGMGKSTLTVQYANEYKLMNPDNMVYVFSRHEEDEVYDGAEFEYEQITLSPDLLDAHIELDDLRDSLVIFDDCDNIQDNAIQKYVQRLVDDLISNGRKYNIYVIYLSHQIMNYGKTRGIINEANKVFFFNNGTTCHNVAFMKSKVGLKSDIVEKIDDLESRWVCLNLSSKPYVIHEKGAFMLK